MTGQTVDEGCAWTYAMITPDGVAGGATGLVLDLITAHGLVPGACRPIGLDTKSMQQFYGGGDSFLITNPGYENFEFPWKTHEALYALGPACLVMLSDRNGDACRAMLRCKGKTRPELAGPSTVRRYGENVIFNLVHCPDDAASARRELGLLVGVEEAQWLISLATPLPPRIEAMVGSSALVPSLPTMGSAESISLPVIVNKIRRRTVQRMVIALHGNDDATRTLSEAHDLLVSERRDLLAGAESRERLLTAIAVNAKVSPRLAAAAAVFGDEVVAEGLQGLSALFDLHGQRCLEPIWRLTDRGVYMSPLERVIVESHGYAFRPNREIDHLY